MRLRVGILVFISFCPVTIPTASSAAAYPDSALAVAITEIQHAILDDQFETARRTAAQLALARPDDPSGLLMAATALLAEMTDREEPLHKKAFESSLSLADSLTDRRLTEQISAQQRSWMYLVKGHVRAYRSVFEARFESLASALRQGLAARKMYQRGLEADSLNTDLYAGLGAYHYWKSAKAGLLRWLGIFSNDRQRGLAEMQRAARESVISIWSTQAALCWVWLDLKQYDSVVVIARRLGRKFPNGKSFRWALAETHEKLGEHVQAAALYDSLAARYAAEPGNYVNLIETNYRAARNWESASRPDELVEAAARLAEYARFVPVETRNRLKSQIKALEKYAEAGPIRSTGSLATDSL